MSTWEPSAYRKGGQLQKAEFDPNDYPMIVVATDSNNPDPETYQMSSYTVHDDQSRLMFESNWSAEAARSGKHAVFTYYAALPISQ